MASDSLMLKMNCMKKLICFCLFFFLFFAKLSVVLQCNWIQAIISHSICYSTRYFRLWPCKHGRSCVHENLYIDLGTVTGLASLLVLLLNIPSNYIYIFVSYSVLLMVNPACMVLAFWTSLLSIKNLMGLLQLIDKKHLSLFEKHIKI